MNPHCPRTRRKRLTPVALSLMVTSWSQRPSIVNSVSLAILILPLILLVDSLLPMNGYNVYKHDTSLSGCNNSFTNRQKHWHAAHALVAGIPLLQSIPIKLLIGFKGLIHYHSLQISISLWCLMEERTIPNMYRGNTDLEFELEVGLVAGTVTCDRDFSTQFHSERADNYSFGVAVGHCYRVFLA